MLILGQRTVYAPEIEHSHKSAAYLIQTFVLINSLYATSRVFRKYFLIFLHFSNIIFVSRNPKIQKLLSFGPTLFWHKNERSTIFQELSNLGSS